MNETLGLSALISGCTLLAILAIACAVSTFYDVYKKHKSTKYDEERIRFESYMEGFKEGCKLHKEIAERRAEKKPDYPIYTDDDCKIILLKDETNAQKVSDR